jgi:hypothetical protein
VCETEAMPQGALTRLVTEALDARLPGPLDTIHERERAERDALRRRLGRR